ncbi:MAG: hypothetical protein JWQ72_148 [Polaromonas sp.]|nr:hypothetical protein [Polaromonas sp.]
MPDHRRTRASIKTSMVNFTLAAAIVAAFLLAISPTWAQGTAGSGAAGPGAGSTGSPGATGNSPAGTSAAPGVARDKGRGVSSASGGPAISRADSSMMADLAQANLAEIEVSKIALEKTQNEQTRKFAQQMIDDHGKALQELQAMAASKGVTLPQEPDMAHKSMAAGMKAMMGGQNFDSEYGSRTGVADHKRTVSLLQKILKTGKDEELRGLAGKMLPVVQEHLQAAQQLASNKKAGSKS